MLEQIHRIDYLQPWGNLNSFYAIEKSFTWLDWLIIEKAILKETFDMDKVSEYRKLQLTLNIMPKGQSILHMLAKASGARMAHINGIIAELFEMT